MESNVTHLSGRELKLVRFPLQDLPGGAFRALARPGWTSRIVLASALLAIAVAHPIAIGQQGEPRPRSFAEVNYDVQSYSVKIYGAGGLAQLEAYQSGIVVSDEGHIATVASLVLDDDEATVIMGDGRKFTATVVGIDPVTEIALLKVDAGGETMEHVDLSGRVEAFAPMRVWAFSNLYNIATGDEPVSVLHGSVSAIAPLEARRGAFASRFRGEVLILDASTNNPGAAGGVLVNLAGEPLGMLGKEVRSEVTGAWLNYALPLADVEASINRILSGQTSNFANDDTDLPEQPATFAALGIHLVPNVVSRTPPYVDRVVAGSPAAAGGIQPDDLVVAIGNGITSSVAEVQAALRRLPGDAPLSITLLREADLLELELQPATDNRGNQP